MSIRYFHLNPITRQGLNILEAALDEVAEKHGIEEPPRFMPTLDDLEEDDDEG